MFENVKILLSSAVAAVTEAVAKLSKTAMKKLAEPKRKHATYYNVASAMRAMKRLKRWAAANGTLVRAPRHILFNAQMAANQLGGSKAS